LGTASGTVRPDVQAVTVNCSDRCFADINHFDPKPGVDAPTWAEQRLRKKSVIQAHRLKRADYTALACLAYPIKLAPGKAAIGIWSGVSVHGNEAYIPYLTDLAQYYMAIIHHARGTTQWC